MYIAKISQTAVMYYPHNQVEESKGIIFAGRVPRVHQMLVDGFFSEEELGELLNGIDASDLPVLLVFEEWK
jgi:hypothetical protein